MSLSFNILASFASQIYVTLVGVVMVPLYLKYLGAEAYGLVGFFSVLVIVFNLLDLGLTPTMARETARFRGGALDALTYRRLVRALEGMFLCIALAGAAAMFTSADYIARDWLHASRLPISEVRIAVELMAATVALRWMCGVYRGTLTGSEQLVWLAGYSSLVATVRFVGVLPALWLLGATPRVFFGYQLAAALLELAVMALRAYRTLPAIAPRQRLSWSWQPLKGPLRFSLTVAFTSSVWVLVTQTDKLVLSSVLPLSAYGHFTLAVLVASGVSIVSGPIGVAIAPRFARLEAQGDQTALVRLYRQTTQLIVATSGAAAVCAALFAEPLLRVWTGDGSLAHEIAPILTLYAIGNGFQVATTQAYYLQFARGDMRMQVLDSIAFVVLLIPTIVWAASRYGALGAGYVWMGVNALNFLVYVAVVHRRLLPGVHLRWLLRDVAPSAAAASIAGCVLLLLVPQRAGRGAELAQLLAMGALVLLVAASVCTPVIERASAWWSSRRLRPDQRKYLATAE